MIVLTMMTMVVPLVVVIWFMKMMVVIRVCQQHLRRL
jgi:hypothetical protein